MTTWRIHHANLPAYDVDRSVDFYREVLRMEPGRPDFIDEYNPQGRKLAWFEADGTAQLHLSEPVPNWSADNGFHINPILRGHTAFTVPDIDYVKDRLRARNVYFADAGNWALKGHYQIYTYDPSLNVIEINQKTDD